MLRRLLHSDAASFRWFKPNTGAPRLVALLACLALVTAPWPAPAQTPESAAAVRQAQRFANARSSPLLQMNRADLLRLARQQHQQMQQERAARLLAAPAVSAQVLASTTSLSTPWQATGPLQVQTAAYGLVTGRISSIAIDPSDATGNTVYVGATGGGVWKSTNGAGSANSVSFAPLTDTLQAFTANAGSSTAIPSLSIGAITVQPGGTGVVLAGTGDPNDATDSYYGQGLLRSTDNGTTWSLVQQANDGVANHFFVGEGFAGFAWSGTSSNLVVAAVSSSAEGTVVKASTLGASVRGLYYSTDAGSTWHLATIQDGSSVVQNASTSFSSYEGNAATAVVWNPLRHSFYAAVRYHGYYQSTDGQTWTRMTNQPGTGLTTSACPTQAGTTGQTACPIFRGALAAQPTSGDLFALTVSGTNADTGLYQDVCTASSGACSSTTVQWGTKLTSTPLENSSGLIVQGDYNLALAAVPAATSVSQNDTLLFVGAGDLYRCKTSDSNGCALRNTTNATTGCSAAAKVAPSQHAIAAQVIAANTAAPLLYFGNDGGLWRSTDGVNQQSTVCSADDATHFDNLNGSLGSLAEVDALSTHPTDGGIGLIALGALGSAASTASSSTASFQSVWTQMGTGESDNVAIDQANPGNWLLQTGYGVSLKTCSNGSSCTAADFAGAPSIGSSQVNGDAELSNAPALLDPALNSNVIVGTCRVYRGPTSGGSAWSSSNAISAPLSGPANSVCSSSNGLIRSLAAGGTAVLTNASQTSGSPVLYAGLAGIADGGGNSAGGHFFRNTQANLASGSTAWTDATNGTVTNDSSNSGKFNPYGFDVSSVSVDPNDPTGKTVYATVSGFNSPVVYRSTDGAATWTNITANLPFAPANAVLVDPNSGTVVYVATDTGVYVATDVTTCAATNAQCWSVYGTGLPNAPAVTLTASVGYAVPGSSSAGVLRVGTYGRGVWQLPLVTAGQSVAPAPSLSPSSLTFAAQNIGYTSAAQTITVTNNGNAPLTITQVSASTSFVSTDTCVGTTLNHGGTCQVQVSFAPTTTGTVSGTLTLYGNMTGGYTVASLSGTGTGQASVVLSPTSIQFSNTGVRSSSAPSVITVTNSGNVAATLQTPTASGDYSISANTCAGTLASGASCTFSVVFTPTAAGVRTGVALLTDNNGTHSVPLSGNGIAGTAVASPTSIVFPTTPLNGLSPVRTVTLQNTGNGALQVGAVTVSGDFAETDNCAHTALASAQSCTVSITFSPTQSGTRTGTLVIGTNSNGDTTAASTVALSGAAQANFSVVLTPTSLAFGSVAVGTASAVANITVSNTGTSSGNLGAANTTGDFSIRANSCGSSLAAQSGCTLSIVFTPTASGLRSGTLTVNSDAGTQTAILTGTGALPATDTLAPVSLSFSSTTANTNSAPQQVTLTNSGDTALTLVSARITSGDFTAVNGCGTSLAGHATCSIAVTFSPKSTGGLVGTLEVSDVLRTQVVTLSGTGVAGAGVSLLPSSLSFAATGVGNATAPQIAVLTNNGGVPLTLGSITVTGDFGLTAASGTCTSGATLPVSGNCLLAVAFAPRSGGPRTGSLSVATSGPTQSLALSGTGIDFTLAASSATSVTVATGKSAVYAMLLTPAVAGTQPVTFTCTGAPTNAKCTVVSTYNDLSATSTVTVTVLTGTTVSAVHGRPDWSGTGSAHRTALALAGLAPLTLLLLPRTRRRGMGLLCLTLFLFAAGCGSGRRIPESTDSGTTGTGTGSGGTTSGSATPTGTYTITVTATAAGLTRQVPVTLIVTAQ